MKKAVLFVVALLLGVVGGIEAVQFVETLLTGGATDAAAGAVSFAFLGAGITSVNYDRFVYEKLKEFMADQAAKGKALDWEDWKIQEGYIRSEKTLKNTNSAVHFDIIAGTRPAAASESLLNRSDSFLVVEHGILLGIKDASGRKFLFSYPSQAIEDVTANTVADCNLIYDGQLNIRTGRKTVRESVDIRQFLNAPQIQKGATPAGAISGPAEVLAALLQDSGNALDALKVTQPSILLNGSDTINISAEYPTIPGLDIEAVTADTEVFLTYYAHGLFLRGVNVNL